MIRVWGTTHRISYQDRGKHRVHEGTTAGFEGGLHLQGRGEFAVSSGHEVLGRRVGFCPLGGVRLGDGGATVVYALPRRELEEHAERSDW